MFTLENYLRASISVGAIDHALRAQVVGGEVRFYIHPNGKDGNTENYRVTGNTVEVLSALGNYESQHGICGTCKEEFNMYGGCRCNGYTTGFQKVPSL